MDFSKNSHVAAAFVKRSQVWYEGTDALAEGTALCFNIVRGTATAQDNTRSSHVIRPTSATAKAFAGVVARDYSAKAGGQFIEVNAPGSLGVKVLLASGNTVIGVTNIVFQHGEGSGKFIANAAVGKGAALAVQTTTGATSCYANLDEGVQSGGVAI